MSTLAFQPLPWLGIVGKHFNFLIKVINLMNKGERIGKKTGAFTF
jgi:hypothetical protein